MSVDPACRRGEAPSGQNVDRRVAAIAAAVAACPLVARPHSGRYGQVATYLPGRRVPGVRLTDTELVIHVAARYPATMTAVAGQVRDAVADLAGGLPVAVAIDDLELPDETTGLPGGPDKEL
ncbi:hypothetical protein J2S53_003080 [Actinopolyspora lacussalsi]|nr:hypothetical protein [Actinopolyspora lacussalsi]